MDGTSNTENLPPTPYKLDVVPERPHLLESGFHFSRQEVYTGTDHKAALVRIQQGSDYFVLPYYYSPALDTLSELNSKPDGIEISPVVKERIKYLRGTLKLPSSLCIYAGFDESIDLKDFQIPNPDCAPTILVGINGQASSGKSTIAAVIRNEFPVFSMDPFVDKNLEYYINYLNNLSSATRMKLSPKEALIALSFASHDKIENDNPNVSLRDHLNKLLERFKKPERPEIMFIDTPGYFLEKAKQRPFDQFDLYSQFSVDVFVNTNLPANPQEEELSEAVEALITNKHLFYSYTDVHEGLIDGIIKSSDN